MADDSDAPQRNLESLDYLTRSKHRVQVLEALTETIRKPGLDTPGYEPRELREMTGASEATVSRILNEFAERGWAERDAKGEYTATPFGQSIALGVVPALDSMEAIYHLGDAVVLLPLNELTIGLEHFRDVTIREPQGPQPLDWAAFIIELLADSSTIYSLFYANPPIELDEEVDKQVTTGSLDSISIMAEHFVEFYVDEVWENPYATLEAGAEWYVYDGHVPCNLIIFDEIVVFENSQVNGFKEGTAIVNQNDYVREWALEVFERYKEESAEFDIEDFS